MRKIASTIITILLTCTLSLGQTAFMQLTPGTSSKSEAERVLGASVSKSSDGLFEYKSQQGGQKLYIQYGEEPAVIHRLEVMFASPVDRAALSSLLGIAPAADTTKWDANGRLEEYFGSNKLVVLTHETSDMASPVMRVGYYSRVFFAVALEKQKGTPVASVTPKSSSPTLTSAKTSPGNSARKVFDKVDLVVPKGDKSDEKSVRLVFDGKNLVIEADKGETIYKSFPYRSIKSADYSYSKHPRWKAALGAAVVLGVFALPILFMKSKSHWLTIKTGDDFAILHLDKDNYKIILPTFETSTGTKVETVAEEK